MANSKDMIAVLRREYATADELAKEVTSYRQAAGLPAINELRYAGYHLLKSICSESENFDNEQLRKSIIVKELAMMQ